MYKFIFIIILAIVGSSALGEAYFLSTVGGNWSDLSNWSSDPDSDTPAFLGFPPDSPDGAWAVLDSSVPDIQSLTIGQDSAGRLDVYDGSSLSISQGLFTAVGADSEATVNVFGGYINAQGVVPGQWAVDGTMHYTQTGGYVIARLDRLAINPGSVVNITITGGVLDLSGAGGEDPLWVPTPGQGRLNIDIDEDGYVLLRDLDPLSNTQITLNGNGRLAIRGEWDLDPTAGGVISSRGTLKARVGIYTFTQTLLYSVCESPVGGDLDGDCRVDMRDLAIMAGNWLSGN